MTEETPRNRQIVDRYAAGGTLAEVATEFGISRQRVHQIISRDAPHLLGRPPGAPPVSTTIH